MLVTVGCAKNEVDTDRMRALLLKSGFEETTEPDHADVIIVNTCSFLGVATQESVETVLSLAQVSPDDEDGQPRIIMCGCVPSRYGDELAPELPEVDAFVPSDQEDGIVSIAREVLGLEASPTPYGSSVLRTVEGASAYVKISDGCDRWCTFCAIPAIRGPYASRPAAEIADEVRLLMKGSVREIVLVGQDTGVWGSDLPGEHDLAWLLEELAEVVSPYGGWDPALDSRPEGMDDENYNRMVASFQEIVDLLGSDFQVITG